MQTNLDYLTNRLIVLILFHNLILNKEHLMAVKLNTIENIEKYTLCSDLRKEKSYKKRKRLNFEFYISYHCYLACI